MTLFLTNKQVFFWPKQNFQPSLALLDPFICYFGQFHKKNHDYRFGGLLIASKLLTGSRKYHTTRCWLFHTNWETPIMTLRVWDWQSEIDMDSIRNSCNVFFVFNVMYSSNVIWAHSFFVVCFWNICVTLGQILGLRKSLFFARDAHPIHPLGTVQICTIQVKTF